MKKVLFSLLAVMACTSFAFARSFDGTQKIYLKANAVSWWTDGNAVQRAVLDNTTPVIGEIEDADRKIYAFTIPAGDYNTIRFERASAADADAWNKTGDIAIPAEGNYVTAFDQNSAEATWSTYEASAPVVYTKHTVSVTNNTGWENFFIYAWGDSEAFGGWPGSSEPTLEFQDADGAVTLHLIIHNNVGEGVEGDVRFNFDITEARDYKLVVSAEGVVEEGHELPVLKTYEINVVNETGWENFWLYEWGTPNEITGAWPGAQGNHFEFKAEEGAEVALHLIFHNNVGEGVEGDARQLYDITEARDYKLVVTATEVKESATPTENILVVPQSGQTTKRIVNGQVVIIRDGKMFNALGAEL